MGSIWEGARQTSCLGVSGSKYNLRQTPSSASQEWQQWCELCQLLYTAASALRRVNGFVQTGILLWSWARPAGSWKRGKCLCLTPAGGTLRVSGTPGPGQGCCWLWIETKNRAKSQTQNDLVSFKLSVALKIPPKAFSLFPTFSLTPLPGCVNPAQPNGIFCTMVWTGKSYNRLDALERMLRIPSLWAKLCANSWFNKNCKIIYIP